MKVQSIALTTGATLLVLSVNACARSTSSLQSANDIKPVSAIPRVGPPNGAVIVVGGGNVGQDILGRFIDMAGGPNALIIDIPTAGGDTVYTQDTAGARMLKAAGAKNVLVMHTKSKAVADADSFAEPLKRAGGVWFEGGRQWHLVDSYANTKTEKGFHEILARGGVMAGSSAGASILSTYLLRGAREGNTVVMAPGYEVGFGFLRNVGIDQHVVARERLADLADSLLPKHPELLGISEDEGTAWLVRGDTADIIGKNKAFVYGGADANDPRAPFLTLRPGDRYNLGTRRVMRRASEGGPITPKYVDELLADFSKPGAPAATVLIAQDGRVLVNRSYGVADQARYMPTTTVPNFRLGLLSQTFHAATALMLESEGKLSLDDALSSDVTIAQYLSHSRSVMDGDKKLQDMLALKAGSTYQQYVTRRIMTPVGMHKTQAQANGEWASNVDELYRWELGLATSPEFSRNTKHDAFTAGADKLNGLGWQVDTYKGVKRISAYGALDGRRHAYIRIPERRVSIIILTEQNDFDARGVSEKILDQFVR